MNSIHVIQPYKSHGQWMFDDPAHEILREPFVSGADEIIEVVAEHLHLGNRFNMRFSASPFPGYHLLLYSRGGGMGGTFYWSRRLKMECWLCPALFAYFRTAPVRLYVQFSHR